MRRNYYRKLLFTYLPVLSCTIAVMILIFIAIINNLMTENTKQANLATTRFMNQVLDDSLKNIDLELYKELMNNGGLRPFFIENPGETDIIRNYGVSNVMSMIMVRYSMIQSISLYRASDRMVMDQSAIRPLGEFQDRALIEDSMKNDIPSRWTAPRMIEVNGTIGIQNEKVVTLVYKVPNRFGLILVNVNVNAIGDILSGMVNTKTSAIDLVDAEGHPFFNNGHLLSENGVLDASVQSSYTGWTLRSGLKNGRSLSFVFHHSSPWIILGILVILIGLYLVVYFTSRHYRPIQQIIQRVSSVARNAAGEAGSSEFDFIDQAVQNLIVTNMAYSAQHERDSTFREKQLFNGLLYGTLMQPKDESEQVLLELGYEIPGLASVALMEIDEYAQFCAKYSDSDQALLKFVKRSVVVEILQKAGQPHFVEWISKNRLVMVLMNAKGQPSMQKPMHDYAEQIRKWIEDNLNYTVTFGLGSEVAHLSKVASSYEEAMFALNYKMSAGDNRVIAIADLGSMHKGNVTQDLKLLQQLIQAFRLGNPRWEKLAIELFHQLKLNQQSRDDTVRLLQYFIYLLGLEMVGSEISSQWKETYEPLLQEVLTEKDTLDNLEPVFLHTLREWSQQLSAVNTQRDHFTLLQEVRRYISDHYTNPDLSLAHLGEKFEVNAKYLSQLFKEETGVNFSDFLTELRIHGAKQLLEETDHSLQSITDQIGYTNAISFSRLFKKQVGMTPIHYRQQQRKAGKTK